jgi:uncharacterized protein (DUF58 family)
MPAAANPLDPAVIARIHGLELRARSVVEGFLAGQHKSSQRGFAVEFAQHREYAPGDDLRHLDWKVFGRTERFYLKQYEQETDFAAWLLVDASKSMAFGGGPLSKYDYACVAAASLASLILRQSDSAGLSLFDVQVRALLPPSSQPPHLKEIVRALEAGPSVAETRIGGVLHEIAERVKRRGLVLIFSDLFDDESAILSGLQHLRFDRHDVIVFHILDAAERDFPFEDPTLFRSLEVPAELLTDPRGLRDGYLRELATFTSALRQGCSKLNIDFVPLRTDDNLGLVLARYLGARAAKMTQ